MLVTFRSFLHQLLDYHDGGQTPAERVLDGILLTLVSLNATAVVLDSVKVLDQQYHALFVGVELVSLYVFTLEYLARVWSCVEDPRYQQPWQGRLRFMLTPLALIDLLAVLPFFLAFGGLSLRLARLLRVVRILKVARYVKALHLIEYVIRRKRTELLVAMGVIGVMLLLVSTLMYAIESEAQPDKFGSIPDTMWWGVATLTTVGYGDVFPITPAGKVLSSVIAVLGLGLFAIPTGILASGFSEHLQEPSTDANSFTYCPHCGKKLG
jgi:voltage-gated potassium channel